MLEENYTNMKKYGTRAKLRRSLNMVHWKEERDLSRAMLASLKSNQSDQQNIPFRAQRKFVENLPISNYKKEREQRKKFAAKKSATDDFLRYLTFGIEFDPSKHNFLNDAEKSIQNSLKIVDILNKQLEIPDISIINAPDSLDISEKCIPNYKCSYFNNERINKNQENVNVIHQISNLETSNEQMDNIIKTKCTIRIINNKEKTILDNKTNDSVNYNCLVQPILNIKRCTDSSPIKSQFKYDVDKNITLDNLKNPKDNQLYNPNLILNCNNNKIEPQINNILNIVKSDTGNKLDSKSARRYSKLSLKRKVFDDSDANLNLNEDGDYSDISNNIINLNNDISYEVNKKLLNDENCTLDVEFNSKNVLTKICENSIKNYISKRTIEKNSSLNYAEELNIDINFNKDNSADKYSSNSEDIKINDVLNINDDASLNKSTDCNNIAASTTTILNTNFVMDSCSKEFGTNNIVNCNSFKIFKMKSENGKNVNLNRKIDSNLTEPILLKIRKPSIQPICPLEYMAGVVIGKVGHLFNLTNFQENCCPLTALSDDRFSKPSLKLSHDKNDSNTDEISNSKKNNQDITESVAMVKLSQIIDEKDYIVNQTVINCDESINVKENYLFAIVEIHKIKAKIEVQRLNLMSNRFSTNSIWLESLRIHLNNLGQKLDKMPLLDGWEVDLMGLSICLKENGGLQKTIENNLWSNIADKLQISMKEVDWDYSLCKIYCKYCLSFDALSDEERNEYILEATKKIKNLSQKLVPTTMVRKQMMEFADIKKLAEKRIIIEANKDENPWEIITNDDRYITSIRCLLTSNISCCMSLPPHLKQWSLRDLTCSEENVVSKIVEPTGEILSIFGTSGWRRTDYCVGMIWYHHGGGQLLWHIASHNDTARMTNFLEHSKLSGVSLPSPTSVQKQGIELAIVDQLANQYVVLPANVWFVVLAKGLCILEYVYACHTSHLVDNLKNLIIGQSSLLILIAIKNLKLQKQLLANQNVKNYILVMLRHELKLRMEVIALHNMLSLDRENSKINFKRPFQCNACSQLCALSVVCDDDMMVIFCLSCTLTDKFTKTKKKKTKLRCRYTNIEIQEFIEFASR